jgi:hypothetical protein
MPFAALGLARVAVTPQVGQDDCEPFREAARNLMPDDMCLWIAVKKEQWRARTGSKDSYRSSRSGDIVDQKARE